MTTESNGNVGTETCVVSATETANAELEFHNSDMNRYYFGVSVTMNTLVADQCRSESVCQFGACQKHVTMHGTKTGIAHRACCRRHELCLLYRKSRQLCIVCGEPSAEESFVCENPECMELALTKRQKFAPSEQLYRTTVTGV